MTQAAANWYYAVGTERNGPIDITALRQMLSSGQLNAHTLVWTDGMPNWIAAITHPDLAVAAQQQMQGTQQAGGYQQGGYTGYVAPGQPLQYYANQPTFVYAGFWLRFAGWLLDFLITFFGGCIVGGVVGVIIGITGGGRGSNPNAEVGLQIISYILSIMIGWLYYAIMESSAAQATLGKMACGIKVTDMEGNRISFGRATGRHFAKLLSGIILGFGYFMAGWTERKQGLHDIIAGTLVVKKSNF